LISKRRISPKGDKFAGMNRGDFSQLTDHKTNGSEMISRISHGSDQHKRRREANITFKDINNNFFLLLIVIADQYWHIQIPLMFD